jgi:hypothetical protein
MIINPDHEVKTTGYIMLIIALLFSLAILGFFTLILLINNFIQGVA